jgi:Na+/proline symporter
MEYLRATRQGGRRFEKEKFLGTEFTSSRLAVIASICTSIGFLGAFAVELTVGSRFLAGLIPSLPMWLVIVILASIGFIYTSAGGFRTVVVTDQFQMVGIWGLIIALGFFYVNAFVVSGHPQDLWMKIPKDIYNFAPRDGLFAFLVGIAVINIPTFIADMSVWQRITSSENPKTIFAGLTRSVVSVSCVWGAIVVLACLEPAIVNIGDQENPLVSFYIINGIDTADRYRTHDLH